MARDPQGAQDGCIELQGNCYKVDAHLAGRLGHEPLFPRQINRLCTTTALLVGMADQTQILEESVIRNAVAELEQAGCFRPLKTGSIAEPVFLCLSLQIFISALLHHFVRPLTRYDPSADRTSLFIFIYILHHVLAKRTNSLCSRSKGT